MASIAITLPESPLLSKSPNSIDEQALQKQLNPGYCHNLVRIFEVFYGLNIDKCKMPHSSLYQLNKTVLLGERDAAGNVIKNGWIDNMKRMSKGTVFEEYLRIFSELLSTKIEHVDFSTFLDRCNKVGLEISDKIKEFREKHVDSNSILCISGRLNKSNFWCALLIYESLLNTRLITHITTDIRDGIFIHTKDVSKPTQIFYVDDCSYSGDQLLDSVGGFTVKNYANLVVYAAVCYISTTAKEKFKKRNIQCLDTSVVFKSMKNYFKEYIQEHKTENISAKQLPEYYNLDKHILYFDHKVADSVSLYNNIIRYGEYYNWEVDKEIRLESFIKNCEDTVHVRKKSLLRPVSSQHIECPPTFYDTIPYDLKPRIMMEGRLVQSPKRMFSVTSLSSPPGFQSYKPVTMKIVDLEIQW